MPNVRPLYEGTFSVATDKIFRRIERDDPPFKASLKLSINPFLIDDGDRKILFDAGLGDLLGQDTSIQSIRENLERESISDYEITDIFLSHLHFDHIGGVANRENGYWELTFPDADLWISKPGWEKLRTAIDKESREKQDFFHFIDSHAEIRFLENSSSKPLPSVRVERIGGHTEFHNALYYENGDHNYVMAGDVIGTRGAINRSYAAKYDFEPNQSKKMREEIQRLSFEKGHVIMAYHETDQPLFRLNGYDEKKGYNIENIGT